MPFVPHARSEAETPGLELFSYYSGWVAYAGHVTTEEVDHFTSSWDVPPAPSFNPLTTLFFFNGLEDKPHDASLILQPVLQYGFSGCGGGAHWTLTSFMVSSSGRAHCGKRLRVHEGDQVVGDMRREAPGRWTVTSTEVASGRTSVYHAEISTSISLVYAMLTMEGIRIYSCKYYPAAGNTTFTADLAAGGVAVAPQWVRTVSHSECGQDLRVADEGTVIISYTNTKV